jgi:hypothetical protein
MIMRNGHQITNLDSQIAISLGNAMIFILVFMFMKLPYLSKYKMILHIIQTHFTIHSFIYSFIFRKIPIYNVFNFVQNYKVTPTFQLMDQKNIIFLYLQKQGNVVLQNI